MVAIRLTENNPIWYQGTLYMVEEVVLDEASLADCHLTEDEHIKAAVLEADTSGHPGYPGEAVHRMTEVRFKNPAYPRREMFRFDRVRADGEILHPYAEREVAEEWMINFYLPFTQNWGEIPEEQFIALPIATPIDIKRRADQLPS